MNNYTVAFKPLTRGGTYFICHKPTVIERRVPKLDKNGRKTRYTTIETEIVPDCGHRVKINGERGRAKFLRHIRRNHA